MKKRKHTTLAQIEKITKELLGGEDTTTAVILLSSALVGPDVKKISAFTHFSEEVIEKRAVNLRASRIWTPDGKVDVDWFDTESGELSFLLDLLVADGLLERKI